MGLMRGGVQSTALHEVCNASALYVRARENFSNFLSEFFEFFSREGGDLDGQILSVIS